MNALFIGLGSIGQRHLRNLKKITPELKIIAYRVSKNVPVLSDKNKVLKKKRHHKHYNIIEVNSLKKGLEYKPDIISLSEINGLYFRDNGSFTIDDKVKNKIIFDTNKIKEDSYKVEKLQEIIDTMNREDTI